MGLVDLTMTSTIVFTLPERPDPAHAEVHWWLVGPDDVVTGDVGTGWIAALTDERGVPRRQVALAPAGAVRVTTSLPPDSAATQRQAESIARVGATDASLGDPQTLHVVSVQANADARSVRTAVVDNGMMLAWLDWARAHGADPDHIVPVAALLPRFDQWTAASIGDQHLLANGDTIIPNEPSLATAIAATTDIVELPGDTIDDYLVAAAADPPLDLRVGRFAKRRRLVIDRDRIRELATLAAVAVLLTLLWSIVTIIRLDRATHRLDAETVALAGTALGRPVAVENAEAEVRAAAGAGRWSFQPSLAALYQTLQSDSGVSSTELGYRPDGTLNVTLTAPTVDAINRQLVALQRDGYRVTAVPRQSPDGRAMVDVTVRSGP